MPARYHLGVDIGGTFTDFVLADERTAELRFHKALTTPDEPARAVVEGLEFLLQRAGVAAVEIASVIHGTTLASNAIIERKGAATGLLTTRGFRDVLEMGTEQRYDIHDLFLTFPEPLVSRPDRIEVDERMDRDGRPLRSPDLVGVAGAIDQLVDRGVRSLAIVFLHSYTNSTHERAVADIVRRVAPHVMLALSHEVAPEIGEYERLSTTVANAYVVPIVSTYLADLERKLKCVGVTAPLYVMLSSGGTATWQMSARFPVRMLESGPAGGAVAARYHAHQMQLRDVVSFDMGGTTAKACLLRDGEPARTAILEMARVHRFKPGSGIPIRAPAIDLLEVGAGGGSIARVDRMGLLKVGPDSAGAVPGPACYGRGGNEPTVTDAALLLGYLSSDGFLGGRMMLDVDAAREAVVSRIAEPLGLTEEQASWGIFSIVSESMASAIRLHCVEHGADPGRLALMAFGGAGPVHAARIARRLRMSRVLCPPGAGVTSAHGFLVSPLSFDYARSAPGLLRELDWQTINSLLETMELDGAALLAEAAVAPNQIVVHRSVDLSLFGQSTQLPIPLPTGVPGPERVPELEAAFRDEYLRRYSHRAPEFPIQAVTWRVSVQAMRLAPPSAISRKGSELVSAPSPRLKRNAYFPETGWTSTPVYKRATLCPGGRLEGPAIVEEAEATTVVPPQVTFGLDVAGTLELELG
jgi:N-methylhydantoinase A/oxoprolinase/acetone carboxylase beta subunit